MNQHTLVLVSGWAVPASVLMPLADALHGAGFCTQTIELDALYSEPCSRDNLVHVLASQLPDEPVMLVGWSMGGMLALQLAAEHPERVLGVVTLASNGRFVANEQWPEAMNPATFAAFYQGITEQPSKTLNQFALLCAGGSDNRKAMAKNLGEQLQPQPSLLPLLKLLGELDVSEALEHLHGPTLCLFGEADLLVPVDAAQRFPQHRTMIHHGGHTFFLDNLPCICQQIIDLSRRITP